MEEDPKLIDLAKDEGPYYESAASTSERWLRRLREMLIDLGFTVSSGVLHRGAPAPTPLRPRRENI